MILGSSIGRPPLFEGGARELGELPLAAAWTLPSGTVSTASAGGHTASTGGAGSPQTSTPSAGPGTAVCGSQNIVLTLTLQPGQAGAASSVGTFTYLVVASSAPSAAPGTAGAGGQAVTGSLIKAPSSGAGTAVSGGQSVTVDISTAPASGVATAASSAATILSAYLSALGGVQATAIVGAATAGGGQTSSPSSGVAAGVIPAGTILWSLVRAAQEAVGIATGSSAAIQQVLVFPVTEASAGAEAATAYGFTGTAIEIVIWLKAEMPAPALLAQFADQVTIQSLISDMRPSATPPALVAYPGSALAAALAGGQISVFGPAISVLTDAGIATAAAGGHIIPAAAEAFSSPSAAIAAAVSGGQAIASGSIRMPASAPAWGAVLPVGDLDFFTSKTALYEVPTVSYGADIGYSFTDSVFGATVTKISSINNEGTGCYVNRHEYSKYPGVNADGTRILTMLSGRSPFAYSGCKCIRNTSTGALIGSRIVDSTDAEFTWHPTDPLYGYYRYGRRYRRMNSNTGAITDLAILFRSDGTTPYTVAYTRGEGRPSDDIRWWACYGIYTSSFTTRDFLVVDLWDGSIRARIEPMSSLGGSDPYGDSVGMSPLGNYAVKLSSSVGTNDLFTKDLQYVRMLFPDAAHGDFVMGQDGEEYYVGHITSANQLIHLGGESGYPNDLVVAYRLADGHTLKALRSDWSISYHISGICSRAHPGWCLVSTYSSGQNSDATLSYWETTHAFQHEIFFLNIHTGEVRRVCHHHALADRSNAEEIAAGTKDYWAEPHATTSWDGNTVVFNSNWGPVERWTRYESYKATGNWW